MKYTETLEEIKKLTGAEKDPFYKAVKDGNPSWSGENADDLTEDDIDEAYDVLTEKEIELSEEDASAEYQGKDPEMTPEKNAVYSLVTVLDDALSRDGY